MNDERVTGTFTDWFNTHGFLDKKALKRWLAGNIEFVGLADPESKRAWEEGVEDARVDEEVVSAGAARLTGASPGEVESAKKRKSKKG